MKGDFMKKRTFDNDSIHKPINKKKILLIFLFVIILIVGICYKTNVFKNLSYKYATHLYTEKDYSSSIESFKRLGNYKESKFYYYDSIYQYAKNLISQKKYREASSQLNLLADSDQHYDYDDFDLLNNQCYFYLSDVQEKYKNGEYEHVISALEENEYSQAKILYNKALDKQQEKEEKYIMSLYKEGDYCEAFDEWKASDYDISTKLRNKIINALCNELISLYKDDSIDFYDQNIEEHLSHLNHTYWTPTYKKWIKAYNDYYNVFD